MSDSTDLVPVSATGEVAILPPEDNGFDEVVPFEPLHIKINRAKGEFWLDGTPAPTDSVMVIPRGSHKAQTFFALRYDPKTPHDPSCQSIDGRTGFGWIDPSDQAPVLRSCAGCVKKGFGAGFCTDRVTLLAYDVARDVPVLLSFQNAEINQRKGVYPLAVNRFRSMGLLPSQAALALSFKDSPDGNYKNLVIDVCPAAELFADADRLTKIQSTLDVCWTAYQAGRQAYLSSL